MNMFRRILPALRYVWSGTIPLPPDDRPFDTDTFILMLVQSNCDVYEYRNACEDWNEGSWESALDYIDEGEIDDYLLAQVLQYRDSQRPGSTASLERA